jgi:hypothetical protein
MWLRIGKDGSIYLGLLQGQPSFGAKGTVVGHGKINVKYKDSEPLKPHDLRKGSRVSFKASGEIHMSSRNLKGEPLANLSKPRQLCLALFTHPSRYRPRTPAAVNDYDMELPNYQINESCPLYASIEVAPWNGESVKVPQSLRRMEVSQSFAFGFANLTRTPDFAIGVTIGHGATGPWPQLPHLAVSQRSPAT